MSFQRSAANPIVMAADIPGHDPLLRDVSAVFNPGGLAWRGRSQFLLRVQNRGRETFLIPASSRDGRRFEIATDPLRLAGLDALPHRVLHVYDPRLTLIDDRIHAVLALDTEGGCRLGVAVSDDGLHYDFLGIQAGAERRNGVLFPEQFGGRYLRLDRPNSVSLARGGNSGDIISLSASDDLLNWDSQGSVAKGRPAYWDELIGPGPPPLKTRAGWLLIYHGIATHAASGNLYQVGAMVLDLKDPRRVLARTRQNLLEPREPYELTGQVPNVVFPSALIPSRVDSEGFVAPDSRLSLYYGAADTCIGLATARLDSILAACED